jgi:hypothetical protein
LTNFVAPSSSCVFTKSSISIDRTVLSGTFSKSSSSRITYWPFDHSKPRTVSLRGISPCLGQWVFIWMRVPHSSWRRWKFNPPLDSVAR